MRFLLTVFVTLCLFIETDLEAIAQGFGASSKGGAGGQVLTVTTLDDDPDSPKKGSLRWAVMQDGPRIIKFAVSGTIKLKDNLAIKKPFLTIDGSDAPGKGICIRDYSLQIKRTHDIIVSYIRIRRGDVKVLEYVKDHNLKRPENSVGLDCVTMEDSSDILFDHCSLSWSCDEIFGITGCNNVTVQWCILAEPLSNPKIHPYGDNHAFGLNVSASRISVHHCLFANYITRGPHFEANDVTPKLKFQDISMEAINNVLFDYKDTGSSYNTGIASNPKKAEKAKFKFQFINNYYISKDPTTPEIYASAKYGVIKKLRAYFGDNIGPHRPNNKVDRLSCVFTTDETPIAKAPKNIRKQISEEVLFDAPVPVTVDSAEEAYQKVILEAGCSIQRDEVDLRILDNVINRRFNKVIKSQDDVGGWPKL